MAYQKRPYTKRSASSSRMVDFNTPATPYVYVPRTPSAYQQAILDWLDTGTGNLLVKAVAGSGKTSTLEMLAHKLHASTNAVFLAFGRAIADELSKRLPFPASTFHSLGNRAVRQYVYGKIRRQPQMEQKKVTYLVDQFHEGFAASSAVIRLVGLYKGAALTPADITLTTTLDLINHYQIDWDDENTTPRDVHDVAVDVLRRNNDDLSSFDFDDMLYWPVIFGLRLDTYDFIMVDEAQDTNEVQRRLISKISTPKTRLVAVGDEYQAIYGFRGASHDAMDLIRSDFDCAELPLSISYRCARAIVQEALPYMPDMVAADNAPDGSVTTPAQWKLTDFLPTDYVVCRNVAPIISLAYRMLAARRGVKVLGREIGDGLIALITKIAGRRGTLDTLPDKVRAYQERETTTLLAKRLEAKAQAVNDRCDAILALLDTMTEDDKENGIAGLTAIIAELFRDKANVTTLSTVHKSKGLEANRVIILDRKLMPSKWARLPWQQRQESNLIGVAITRAKTDLVYLDSEVIAE